MDLIEFLRKHKIKTIHDTLGIVIEETNPERVVLSMEVTERVHQFTQIMHGGVSAVLAESAASIGAALNTDLTRFIPVGVEISANHLRSISNGTVKITAVPSYIGSKMMVWSIEIHDQRQRLISVARCTIMLRSGNAAKFIEGSGKMED
jgi:uncharacterized protein (TIGR00369 family)